MEIIFFIAILIFSIVIHEVSHGFVANALGDSTAKLSGRLTLNPIPHLDPIGSILVPVGLIILAQVTGGAGFIFGWAKPVPVNPYNLRGKYGSAIVSLAGPASNIAIALVFGLALRFLPIETFNPSLVFIFGYIVYLNILLAVFNLLPIPPLDGSHILFSFLPRSAENIKRILQQYGFMLILLLVFFFFPMLSIVIRGIFKLIVGTSIF